MTSYPKAGPVRESARSRPCAEKGEGFMSRLEAGDRFPELPGLGPVNAERGKKAFVLYFFPKAFTGG
jgi:hypothetical protein